jgi:hypothetical protein
MNTLALGLLLTLGSFAQKIEIESGPAVNFSKFRTFAIRHGRLNSRNPSLNCDLIRKRIDASIQKYPEAKGLIFVPSGPSDLNVRYTLGAVRMAIDLRNPSTVLSAAVRKRIMREKGML